MMKTKMILLITITLIIKKIMIMMMMITIPSTSRIAFVGAKAFPAPLLAKHS